jgi:hypothetical protein
MKEYIPTTKDKATNKTINRLRNPPPTPTIHERLRAMGQPVLRRPAVETNPPLGVVPIARPRHVGAVLQHVSGLPTSVAVHLGRLPLVRTGSVTLGETRCASSPALSPLAGIMLWPQKLGTTLFVRHLGFLLCGHGRPIFLGNTTMHISFSMGIIATSFLFQSSLSCQAFPFAFVGTFLGLFFKGQEQGNHSDENVSDKTGTTAEPPNQLGRHLKMAPSITHGYYGRGDCPDRSREVEGW